MKPVLGAWKLSQRAVAPLAFLNVWTRLGGTATNVPGRRPHRFDVGADPELQLAFEDVERVDMLVVDVRVWPAFSRLVPGPGGVEQRVLAERAHRASRALRDRRGLFGRPEHERLRHVAQPPLIAAITSTREDRPSGVSSSARSRST